MDDGNLTACMGQTYVTAYVIILELSPVTNYITLYRYIIMYCIVLYYSLVHFQIHL